MRSYEMLRRLTCFVVIFSIIRSAYCADEDARISVAIPGGGYTGVLTGILLGGLRDRNGDQLFDVHIFERNLNLMNGASTLCARRHYGGEYPTDRNTAEQCLFSSLLYQQMFPTETILTGRRRNDFLVANESTTTADPNKQLSLDQVHQHYAHLQDLYRTIFGQFSGSLGDEEAARRLFGKPDDFVEFLRSSGDIGDERLRAHFAGGVSTGERGFQPFALGVILERLLAQNTVRVHLGCTVENAESVAGTGYRLHYSSQGKGKQEFFADYVIGAAWHENPYLNIIAASRDVAVQGNLATKVYLRSIGLFDISNCTNIPDDRSYFGLKGSAGGMVSFYTSSVAAIYIPEEGCSLQGSFELSYDQARSTFLPRVAQQHLEKLNGPQASRVLNQILGNATAKYPFLKGASPITLLTRTTVSVDPRVEQRSHVKPIWPLGEEMRWIEAESTKATFAPVTALQVLGEIIRQPDVRGKISLSEDAEAFLAALYQLNFLDGAGRPRENLLRLPAEFMLFEGDLTNDLDLAEMQLYALKRRLPFAMMEPFSRRDMVTIRPDLQILTINWNVLDDVDLRSISPTIGSLKALADAVNALPSHKGFKSFRFKYYGEGGTLSPDHIQAGLKLLRALGGNDPDVRRPIDELEIDQLHLTLEDEAKALLDIIVNSGLKKLILTQFSTSVSLQSFTYTIDLASSLQSTRILFDDRLNYQTLIDLFNSFQVVPDLNEFIFSKNHLGEVLSGHDKSRKFARLLGFIKTSEKLQFLDLSENGLFENPEDPYKHDMLDAIRYRRALNVDMRGNGLNYEDETSQKYFLLVDIKELKDKKQRLLEKMHDMHTRISEIIEGRRGSYYFNDRRDFDRSERGRSFDDVRAFLITKLERSTLNQERVLRMDANGFVRNLTTPVSRRQLSEMGNAIKALHQDLRSLEDESQSLERDVDRFSRGDWRDSDAYETSQMLSKSFESMRYSAMENIEQTHSKIQETYNSYAEKLRDFMSDQEILYDFILRGFVNDSRQHRLREVLSRYGVENLRYNRAEIGTVFKRLRERRQEFQYDLLSNVEKEMSETRFSRGETIRPVMQRMYEHVRFQLEKANARDEEIYREFERRMRDEGVSGIISGVIDTIGKFTAGLTGHSLGGSLAHYSGSAMQGIDPAGFNRYLFSESLRKIQQWSSSSRQRVSSIYVAYEPEMEERGNVDRLYDDLAYRGLFDNIFRDERNAGNRPKALARIGQADRVLVIGSKAFKEHYDNRKIKSSEVGVVNYEMDAIRLRFLEKGDSGIIPIYFSNQAYSSYYSKDFFSATMKPAEKRMKFNTDTYYESFFDVLEKIYDDALDSPVRDIKLEFKFRKK